MKPVYIVSWLFALAVSFVSCDDWLDKTPKDRLALKKIAIIYESVL